MNLLRLKKGLICLTVVMGLLAVFSNVLVCAEKSEADFICGTEPEAMQAGFNALLQKKLTPQIMPNNENASVQLSSVMDHIDYKLMPSTGDVKALVLPIEFKDEKLSGTITEKLQDAYFSEKNLNEDYSYEDLSLSDYFKKMSYNKLRITGTVLPVYTAEEDREYYNSDKDAQTIRELIAKAIVEYKDIIGDLTEYDSDGDGGIDCLHVVWAGSAGDWIGPWWSGMFSAKQELYDDIKMVRFVGIAEEHCYYAPKHETAHLMGLPDNYVHMYSSGYIGNECLIDSGVREMTNCTNGYINMYYKYLLDWISEEDGSLVIITYDDLYNQDKTNNLREIELSAAEQYGDEAAEKPKAVFFVSDKINFPFDKFYFAEYRSGITAPNSGYNDNPGILMWHCDTNLRPGFMEHVETPFFNLYNNKKGYLKPIYKSIESGTGNEAFVPAKDLYFEGEEFSSKTAPSSEAYKARETGAYLKVNALSQETANITAGYIDPYLGPAPEIKIQSHNDRKYVSASVTLDVL